MSEQSAIDICKALLAENHARMDGIYESGENGEMVSPLDQLVGIAIIMRSVGLPVIRQERGLIGHNAMGIPIRYEMMGLLVEGTLIGLEGEDSWEEIENTERSGMSTSLSMRLIENTQSVNLGPADDAKARQDIAQHFPGWHRWVDEKIAELSRLKIDTATVPTTAARPSPRL